MSGYAQSVVGSMEEAEVLLATVALVNQPHMHGKHNLVIRPGDRRSPCPVSCVYVSCRQRVTVEPEGVANLKRLRKDFDAALQAFKVCVHAQMCGLLSGAVHNLEGVLEVESASARLYQPHRRTKHSLVSQWQRACCLLAACPPCTAQYIVLANLATLAPMGSHGRQPVCMYVSAMWLQAFPEDPDALLEVKKTCTKLYQATGPAKVRH